MVPTLPKVSEAYRLFAQEERHKEVSQASNQVETLAFAAEKRRFTGDHWNSSNKTYKTGFQTGYQSGSQKSGGTNRFSRPGSNYYCTHCQTQGHSVERCFKIHGYPPGYKTARDNKVAAVSFGDNSNNSVPELPQTEASPTITVEQYQQLMDMLSKQQQQNANTNPNLAMMAAREADSSW
ncbi:uncharacterized protein [Spinacia oleracea]|uniref:CCHC-type domain-containing protein n=1 Tax=Spinacia oleracea TaxID=3562 RepID=A0ABM3R2R9_SPIOL|nr:uncharacterized protein LOC130464361 [Spinacia oleracea]